MGARYGQKICGRGGGEGGVTREINLRVPTRSVEQDVKIGAVERNRTSTSIAHSALNAARLPVPPRPQIFCPYPGCLPAIRQSTYFSAHGPYHVRNVALEGAKWATRACAEKYVLCRCGHSRNKPFCDGAHYDVGWRDDVDQSTD